MAAKYKSIALALATALATAPIMVKQVTAQQIGTTTAVNPGSEATPPGGSTTALTVGARVLHKERIHTSPTGSVQLLFLDKSTLSIAPNTSLVIDEFVYDPASNSGHMLAKLTQGTLQYIDARHAAIYRRPAQPSGRGHGGDACSRHRHPRRHRHFLSGPKWNAGHQFQRQALHSKWRRYDQYDHRVCDEHSQLEYAAKPAISDPARPGPP